MSNESNKKPGDENLPKQIDSGAKNRIERVDFSETIRKVEEQRKQMRANLIASATCKKCGDTGITNSTNDELKSKVVVFSENRAPEYCTCVASEKAKKQHSESETIKNNEREAALSARLRSYGFPDRYTDILASDFTNHPTNRISAEQLMKLVKSGKNLSLT